MVVLFKGGVTAWGDLEIAQFKARLFGINEKFVSGYIFERGGITFGLVDIFGNPMPTKWLMLRQIYWFEYIIDIQGLGSIHFMRFEEITPVSKPAR